MTDTTNLRTLAQAAAVEGPWAVWHDLDHQGFKTVGDAASYAEILEGGVADDCNPVAHVYTEEDAAFIAAVDPSTVLALLDERDRLETAIREALGLFRGPTFQGSALHRILSAALGGE